MTVFESIIVSFWDHNVCVWDYNGDDDNDRKQRPYNIVYVILMVFLGAIMVCVWAYNGILGYNVLFLGV